MPAHPPRPRGGRPRISDRAALTGILFVLITGTPWEYLPPELGCGSGMTCWRRLRDWSQAGLWRWILAHLHQELGLRNRIDWERALADTSLVPAKRGAILPDPTLATGAGGAASICSSPTVKASRWPSGSPPPTSRTCGAWSRCSTRCSPSHAQQVGRAKGPPSCMPTRASTRRKTEALAVVAGSRRVSPGVVSSPQKSWGGIVGRSSAPSRGCTATGGC